MGTISLSVDRGRDRDHGDRPALPAPRPAHPAPVMQWFRNAPFRLYLGLGCSSALFLVLGGLVPSLFAPVDPLAWYTAPRNQVPSWAHVLGTTSLGQDIFWLLALALQQFAAPRRHRRLSRDADRRLPRPCRRLLRRLARPGHRRSSWMRCSASRPADPDPDGGALRRPAVAAGDRRGAPGIFNWPYPGRQVRAVALTMREREFVNVAWFCGESPVRILTRHIFPYIAGWSMANFINTMLVVIATESRLAVIGLSSAQQATLGTMIYWAIQYQALLAGRYVWVGAAGARDRADVHRPVPALLGPLDALGQPEARADDRAPRRRRRLRPGPRLRRRGRWRQPHHRGRRDPRHRRRVRLRQVHADARALRRLHPRPPQARRHDHGPLHRPRDRRARSQRDRRDPARALVGRRLLHPAGLDERAEPADDAWRSRSSTACPGASAAAAARRCARGSRPSSPASASTPACSTPIRTSSPAACASACWSRSPPSSNPRMILADEPTTALDVVVQKRILLMLVEIQRRLRNTLVLVSHDLGVHYQVTDRIAIAYAGKIVEFGPTQRIFAAPAHPYTQALVAALPRIGEKRQRERPRGPPAEPRRPARRLPLRRALPARRRTSAAASRRRCADALGRRPVAMPLPDERATSDPRGPERQPGLSAAAASSAAPSSSPSTTSPSPSTTARRSIRSSANPAAARPRSPG